MNYTQQVNCLSFINTYLNKGGILLISCFERLDLIEEAYNEWGFSSVSIDYSRGVVDLGSYCSNWNTKNIFLPFFEKNRNFCLKDVKNVGLGAIYIFGKEK